MCTGTYSVTDSDVISNTGTLIVPILKACYYSTMLPVELGAFQVDLPVTLLVELMLALQQLFEISSTLIVYLLIRTYIA